MSLLPAILSLGGSLFGGEDRERARQLEEQAIRGYDGIRAPGESDLYRPVGGTEFDKLRADPVAMAGQQRALGELQNIGREGYGVQDKAAIRDAMGEVSGEERGQRMALQDSMRARGLGNSGMSMAAQMAAQQGGANRASSAGANIAAAGRNRALQALTQSGALAGQMRGQGFQEGAARAGAQDSINLRNANARQAAAQQGFGNAMDLAGAKSGAQRYGADVYQQRANYPAQLGASIGEGFDQVAEQGMGLAMGMPTSGRRRSSGGF